MPTRKTTSRKSLSSRVQNKKKSVAPANSKLKNLLLPAIIILLVVIFTLFKNQFIVAEVNGQPITRLQLINALEKKDGKTVLDSLITEQLILQEASKRKVTVSASEVSSQISQIEKSVSSQGQSLDALLAQQGMSRSDLNDQVKIQLLLKKMVGGKITVSDKEVNDYIEQNKDSIPQGTDPATLKTQAKQQLEQQKLNTGIQTFVSALQKKAKVQYLRNY